MQSRLVLVRHGKPEIEEGTPSTQWPLSQPDLEAAASLATQLLDFKFQSITSSPELKATGTAEAIAEKLGLKVELDDDLAEHKRHSTGFLPLEDFNTQIARLFESPWSELVFSDETANGTLERFTRALDRQYVSSGAAMFWWLRMGQLCQFMWRIGSVSIHSLFGVLLLLRPLL